MTDEQSKYHSERAMAELDMALRAGNADAARAHFRLSSLHLERSKAEESTRPALGQHHL
jgi:hypothetical protein